MGLTIDHRNAVDLRIEAIVLRPIAGAHELLFLLHGKSVAFPSRAAAQGKWLTIYGAEVSVSSAGGDNLKLGLANPSKPFRVMAGEHVQLIQTELRVVLQPQQIAAIEAQRIGTDLRYQLELQGEAYDGVQFLPVCETLSRECPRSQWIEQLTSARAREIMLVEVPMPIPDASPEWKQLAKHLKKAQQLLFEGHYPECVIHCRKTLECLGQIEGRKKNWAPVALDKLCKDRSSQSQREREIAMQAALHHFANPSAHSGDVHDRNDAILALSVCAAFIAHSVNATQTVSPA